MRSCTNCRGCLGRLLAFPSCSPTRPGLSTTSSFGMNVWLATSCSNFLPERVGATCRKHAWSMRKATRRCSSQFLNPGRSWIACQQLGHSRRHTRARQRTESSNFGGDCWRGMASGRPTCRTRAMSGGGLPCKTAQQKFAIFWLGLCAVTQMSTKSYGKSQEELKTLKSSLPSLQMEFSHLIARSLRMTRMRSMRSDVCSKSSASLIATTRDSSPSQNGESWSNSGGKCSIPSMSSASSLSVLLAWD
mmetsp:Transcript_7861/g.17286  ORF Transcript_7861/g.17286 Transcript_7861/m.17286 type:complete len:247 (+) Transcript_7861:356-1096(+)